MNPLSFYLYNQLKQSYFSIFFQIILISQVHVNSAVLGIFQHFSQQIDSGRALTDEQRDTINTLISGFEGVIDRESEPEKYDPPTISVTETEKEISILRISSLEVIEEELKIKIRDLNDDDPEKFLAEATLKEIQTLRTRYSKKIVRGTDVNGVEYEGINITQRTLTTKIRAIEKKLKQVREPKVETETVRGEELDSGYFGDGAITNKGGNKSETEIIAELFEKKTGIKFDPEKHEIEWIVGADGEDFSDFNQTPYKVYEKKTISKTIEPDPNLIAELEYKLRYLKMLQIEKIKITDKTRITDRTGKHPVPKEIPPDEIKREFQLEKTPLQIFREQFNQMPEIKNRHTASERLPWPQALITGGGIAVATLAPVALPAAIAIGAGAAITSAALKPILYRLTGQKKLEKQITEQLLKMDPKEFDRMTEWMTEEKIVELKPNAVILRAMHKALVEKTKQEAKALTQELKDKKDLRDRLNAKVANGQALTDDEKRDLNSALDRIKEIEEERTVTTQDGKTVHLPSESDRVQRRLKEVRRGKDRVSQRYKGNLRGQNSWFGRLLNPLAHRNTNSEDYRPIINELADAEYARDLAQAMDDTESRAQMAAEYDKVLADNTRVNKLGISKGVFEAKEGALRIMSDTEDKTAQKVARGLVIAAATVRTIESMIAAEKANAANEAEINRLMQERDQAIQEYNNLAKQVRNVQGQTRVGLTDAQNAVDGVASQDIINNEVANLRQWNGHTGDAGYKAADQAANASFQQGWGNRTQFNQVGGSVSLEDVNQGLATEYANTAASAQNLGAVSAAHSGYATGSHTFQNSIEANMDAFNKALQYVMGRNAHVIHELNQIATNAGLSSTPGTFSKSTMDLFGPIVAALLVTHSEIDDDTEQRRGRKDKKQVEREQ